MFFSESIPLYLDSRKADAYSSATIANDKRHLYRMMDIVGDIDLKTMSPNHLDRVLHLEAERGLSPGSLNLYHAVLAAFARWCRDRGHMNVDQNPIGTRRYRKDPPKRKPYIHISEFPGVLDAAEVFNPRDRGIVAAGLFLLLRQSELIALRVKDVDLQSGEVSASIFKTKEHDLMPISTELDVELRKWLTFYANECGELQPDWYLFPAGRSVHDGKKGMRHGIELRPLNKITQSSVIVKRAVKHLKFGKDELIGFHLLRRSSARAIYDELVASGYSGALRRVQTLLHHSTSQMTERYLGLDFDIATRNAEIKGNLLFPSLAADNVVPIRRDAHG